MKKLLFTLSLALMLGGCLSTENRRVKVRRDIADIESGVSIIDSSTQPWWAKNTAGIPDDENPWLEHVHTKEDRWYDPWGQDPLSNYGVEPLADQIHRLGPPPKEVEPEPKAPRKEDTEKVLRLLERKLDEYRRNREQRPEVY